MYFDVEVHSFLPAVISDVRSVHDYRKEGKDTEEEGDVVVEEMRQRSETAYYKIGTALTNIWNGARPFVVGCRWGKMAVLHVDASASKN